MAIEKAEGKVQDMIGQGQEAIGDALDDASMKAKGIARQAQGKLECGIGAVSDNFDDVMDTIQTVVQRHPVGAVVAVGAVAYLLGRLRSGLRHR